MTTPPMTPDEILVLVEDLIFVNLQDFTQLQLNDLARMTRQIARAADEVSRCRDRCDADQR